MPQAAQDLPRKFRRLLPVCLWVMAFAYFTFHTFQGERGLAQWHLLSTAVADAESQAEVLAGERARWAHRVSLLGNKGLDLDMLEERARVMLNMGRGGDVVILSRPG